MKYGEICSRERYVVMVWFTGCEKLTGQIYHSGQFMQYCQNGIDQTENNCQRLFQWCENSQSKVHVPLIEDTPDVWHKRGMWRGAIVCSFPWISLDFVTTHPDKYDLPHLYLQISKDFLVNTISYITAYFFTTERKSLCSINSNLWNENWEIKQAFICMAKYWVFYIRGF